MGSGPPKEGPPKIQQQLLVLQPQPVLFQELPPQPQNSRMRISTIQMQELLPKHILD